MSYLKWNDDITGLGIVDNNPFNKFLYKRIGVYFISNFLNLNNEFHQFQVNDTKSLSGQILSFEDCSIKFIINHENKHVLKFEEVSKLEGLGWIEYSFKISEDSSGLEYSIQPSIEVKCLNMQVDYIRFIYDWGIKYFVIK
ncbi:unnamed protein product [Rhizophagus irregularis]|nr:unnamed protein product [Rhizophagus irregularis]